MHESDQLEEGEIVDDDDFEEISDNSIIDTTLCGKFVSPNENLRALSLSSNSDMEPYKNVKHRKKLLARKSRIKRQKKRKKRTTTSSDSSVSDVSTCQDIKGKLKEAVHISGSVEGQKNTLETRLKGMWGVINNKNSLVTKQPPNRTDTEDNNLEKNDDYELEKLRIEALKTAVLNKFQRRKRKKAMLDEQQEENKSIETLENKENDTPKCTSASVNDVCSIENTDNIKTTALDLEEDEDVLRASLLAGLAKKITKADSCEKVDVKPVAPKLPALLAPVLPKLSVNNAQNKKMIQNRPKMQVKPLIINVNGDSDSEEEIQQKKHPTGSPSNVKDLAVITNSVEKFLKEQRAKFETETKKRFQIVHKNKNKSFLEKSAVKLLPKSQQIEYQQLLKKLKSAENRKKVAICNEGLQKTQETVAQPQILDKVTPPVNTETSSKPAAFDFHNNQPTTQTLSNQLFKPSKLKVTVKPIIEVKSSIEDLSKGGDSKENDPEKKKSGITNELTVLQKTLREMKMQRNGSLQIKSKYQVLTPIIRKITAASNERKKQEQRIKNLLQDLNEARNCLTKSHEKFTILVRELVASKEKIDNSYRNTKAAVKKTQPQNGSIVKKCVEKNFEVHDTMSKKCMENQPKSKKSSPVTWTPIKQQTDLSMMNLEDALSTVPTNSTTDDYVDMDVCNSDETDMCQIDIVDPNDIDQIFTRKSVDIITVPEYVSPLNLYTCERYKHVDPHGIMCPYEVNGSCRDVDCTFKHYLKSITKP